MKNYLLLLIVIITVYICSNNNALAQDILKTKSGEEIKVRMLNQTRKESTYQIYDDPEFGTNTIPYKEVSSIQYEGEEKPILFNHKLPRAFVCVAGGTPGLQIALGNLAKTNFNDSKNEPGFGNKEGFNLKFEGGFYLYKRIGLDLSMGVFSNKFNYDKYGQAISNGEFVNISDGGSNNKWSFAHWMIGPMYSIKLAKQLTWDLKAKAGLISTKKPSVVLNYSQPNGPSSTNYEIIYHSDSKTVLSYSLGTSFRYAITKRIAAIISADYMHTSPTISYDIEVKDGTDIGTSTVNTTYKLSTLNLSLGVAYQFKRKGNKYE